MAERLGKLEHKADDRTLRMELYMAPPDDMALPVTYDLDKGRKPFPVSSWGNDLWGDCVIAGRANQTVRLERIERRVTLALLPTQVIEEYKNEAERQMGHRPATAGDAYDHGLYMLDAQKDWRVDGWTVPKGSISDKTFRHKIAAFGQVVQSDVTQMKLAIYLLRGVQLGFDLPLTARNQWRGSDKRWFVVPGIAPETKPGSWGGHCVYAKRYDADNLYVITWGREIPVSWEFVSRYCDEAWAVVDDLNSKATKRILDVQAMIKHLRDIGATNVQ